MMNFPDNWNLWKSQMEILELENVVNDTKYSTDGFSSMLDIKEQWTNLTESWPTKNICIEPQTENNWEKRKRWKIRIQKRAKETQGVYNWCSEMGKKEWE